MSTSGEKIQTQCPECLALYSVPLDRLGMSAKCKTCRQPFTVKAFLDVPAAEFPPIPEFDTPPRAPVTRPAKAESIVPPKRDRPISLEQPFYAAIILACLTYVATAAMTEYRIRTFVGRMEEAGEKMKEALNPGTGGFGR